MYNQHKYNHCDRWNKTGSRKKPIFHNHLILIKTPLYFIRERIIFTINDARPSFQNSWPLYYTCTLSCLGYLDAKYKTMEFQGEKSSRPWVRKNFLNRTQSNNHMKTQMNWISLKLMSDIRRHQENEKWKRILWYIQPKKDWCSEYKNHYQLISKLLIRK